MFIVTQMRHASRGAGLRVTEASRSHIRAEAGADGAEHIVIGSLRICDPISSLFSPQRNRDPYRGPHGAWLSVNVRVLGLLPCARRSGFRREVFPSLQ